MKTFSSRRMTALFLALLMSTAIFVSCSTPKDDDVVTTSAPSADGTTAVAPGNTDASGDTQVNVETTANEEQLFAPTVNDEYSGTKFIMLASTNKMGYSDLYFSTTEGYTGAAVSDALYARKLLMNEKYGIELEVNVDSKAKDKLSVALGAGDYICDISLIPSRDSFSLALNGYYIDVNSLDKINLENSYWDQRIQVEYAVGKKLFFLEGDYTILDELRTMVCVYNDTLYNNYGYYEKYGSPYSMVQSGKWTYDTMMTMTKDMYQDLNNNGMRDEEDAYGMVGELSCVYYFFLGSGNKTIDNSGDAPKLLITDNDSYAHIFSILESTMQMAINDSVLMPQLLTASDVWAAASSVFECDRALFRSTTLSAVTRLTEMASNYGILPIPAFTENQDGYYCWVSGVGHCPLGIPYTVANADKNAAISELLCYHSKYGKDTLYEAFYEVMKIAKLCRQEEDVAMLDLVFNSKTFDFDYTTQITNIESSLYGLAKSRDITKLNSSIMSLRKLSETNLKRFLAKIDK